MISNAYAQGAATAAEGGFPPFMIMILMFGVFYFLLIRPQQKQQKEHKNMIAGVKRGDQIVTASGIHGEVTSVESDYVMVNIAKNVDVKLDKAHIHDIKNRTKNESKKAA